MGVSKIAENFRKAYNRLEDAIRQSRLSLLKLLRITSENPKEGEMLKPQIFAYRLLGERTAMLLPLFKDVDVNLQRSGMKVSFKGYVSLALLTTMLTLVSVLIIIPPITLLLFHLSSVLTLLYTLAGTLFAGAFSIIGFYLYPIVRAESRKRNLEDALPFSAGYLSILAGAGVPPTQMFHSLSKIDTSSAVSQEAKCIARDVELFGLDIISAMDAASKRTPSEKFKELIEGLIATVHSGGDLAKYLRERSTQYMRLKRIALRRFGDTLGVLAEFYVVLLVAGPLIMVVMLAVMAMLGGGNLGGFSPKFLLYLLTYVGIPLGSTAFLIMLDTISPKR